MIYFTSHNIPENKLHPVIGEPVKKGVTGSNAYYIKCFDSEERIELMEDAKGVFQVFTNGLLLRAFKNNRSISLPIPFSEISKLELIKGKESIKPIPLYPMWILLKLGVRIEIARYLRMRVGEYSIESTVLNIETQVFKIRLETNGYTFDSQENYFSKLTKITDFKIKKPALTS